MKAPGILFIVVLVIALQLSACGGGGGSTSIPTPPQTSNIRHVSADLVQFVESDLSYVQRFSEGYVIPTASQLGQFDDLIVALVSQDIGTVETHAPALNFELIRFTDTGAAGNELYCLLEVVSRGQGFYCADFDASATHHVSVPHPLYDSGTNAESAYVMRATGARFLSVSTTHRCANAAASSCPRPSCVRGDSTAAGPA